MLVFLAVAFYVVLASACFIEEDKHQPEYYSLILLATVGMMVVACATDLIALFVGIELTCMSSYALVAFRKKDEGGRGGDEVLHHRRAVLRPSPCSAYPCSTGSPAPPTSPASNAVADELLPACNRCSCRWPSIMIVAGFGFKVAMVPVPHVGP